MERIKELDRYQKFLLILLLVMAVGFTTAYCVVNSREGLLYRDSIFLPEKENGSTVYVGRLEGEESRFTVTADQTVTFQWGSKVYGPYTVKEDPTAIPKDRDISPMKGVEIRDGEDIFFRGGIWYNPSTLEIHMLFSEDGDGDINIIVSSSDGITTDADGNVIDPMEPSAYTILELLAGPKLEKKAHFEAIFFGILFSVVTVVSILFADELFRFRLSFQVADAYDLEPSDWEVLSRYIAWTVMTGMILVLYIVGLQ